MRELLRVERLCVKYGQVAGVHDVSLRVAKNEIVALLGLNGAGKTTTMLAVAGILPASKGKISFEGREITGEPVQARVRMGLSLAPEGRRVFSLATVRENLLIGAHTRSGPEVGSDLERMYRLFPPLFEKRNVLAMSLSGGQQQMLSIARALMSRPRLLLLDEPTMGLSPAMCADVYRFIEKSRSQGLTVLVSGEDARRLLSLCDRAVTIVNGVL